MPGARLVGKIEQPRTAWDHREQALTTGSTDVAGSFGQAAQLYSTNEQAARNDLHQAGNVGGRRPV